MNVTTRNDPDAMPLVSVLVTVYNREMHLAEAIESILGSTWQDFEIIVVDDNSSDNSLDLAKQFAARDTRIKVYFNETNQGDYPNRNRAASLAKGKYLKYLDADDMIYEHSISIMVEALERYPEAALALSSNIIDPPQPYPIFYQPAELQSAHFLGRSPLGVGPSASIIRRESFEAIGGFSGKQYVSDTELWLKMAERWPIVALPPALVWWRQHEGQQIRLEKQKPEMLTVRYKLEVEMLRISKHLSEAQKLQALEYLSHLHARRMWSVALKGKGVKTALRLLKDSGLSTMELLAGLRKPLQR